MSNLTLPLPKFTFDGKEIDVNKFVFVPEHNIYLDIDNMIVYNVNDNNVLTETEITESEETREKRMKNLDNQVENGTDGGARHKSSRKIHKKKTRRNRRKSVRHNRRR